MKFSFEKPKQQGSGTEEGFEAEISNLEEQEKFDVECIEEAEKLGTNIEALKMAIDELGGPDKVKEIFERPRYNDGSGTKAGEVLNDFEDKKDKEAFYGRFNRNIALVMGGIVALEAYVLEGETVSDKLQEVKQIWENSKVDGAFSAAATALFAGLGINGLVQSLKARFEVRRLEKQQKIESLKFKMTDTEVK